jgi:flagellar biosynthesis protein FlhF
VKKIKKLSFIGKNSEDAFKKATEVCGPEAYYISSKIIEKEGIKLHEIIVGIDEDMEEAVENETVGIDLKNLKKDRTPLDKPINKSIPQTNELKTLKEKISELNSNMLEVNKFLLTNYDNNKTELPPEYIGIENILNSSNINLELHKLILNILIKKTPHTLRNKKKLNRILYDVLTQMIKVDNTKYSKITLFCGPTGVGKTTTIAKLSAKLKIENPKTKIGVISLDNYKVGAFKQLEAYSEVLDLPLEIIDKPNQLIKAFHTLKHMDYIFIDTAGSSPYDVQNIQKLEDFLNYHSKLNIEKVLVLPATLKYEDAKDAYVNFNIIEIDSLIITKMDETFSYGDTFSFINFSKTPVRNFGIGQTVPDDFISASKTFFIDLLLKRTKIIHKRKEV